MNARRTGLVVAMIALAAAQAHTQAAEPKPSGLPSATTQPAAPTTPEPVEQKMPPAAQAPAGDDAGTAAASAPVFAGSPQPFVVKPFEGPHEGGMPYNLDTLPVSRQDRAAIARVAYAEAANQGDDGLAGVIFVILNRAMVGSFGQGVQGVINAPGQFEPVTTAGGSWRNLPPLTIEQQIRFNTIFNLIFDGLMPDPTNGALYFQNPAIVAARESAGTVSLGLTNFGGQSPIAVIRDHAFFWQGARVGLGTSAPPAYATAIGIGADASSVERQQAGGGLFYDAARAGSVAQDNGGLFYASAEPTTGPAPAETGSTTQAKPAPTPDPKAPPGAQPASGAVSPSGPNAAKPPTPATQDDGPVVVHASRPQGPAGVPPDQNNPEHQTLFVPLSNQAP